MKAAGVVACSELLGGALTDIAAWTASSLSALPNATGSHTDIETLALLGEGDNFRYAGSVYLTMVWCLRELRRYREALAVAEEGLRRTPDAVLAQWATQVEEDLARAERERC